MKLLIYATGYDSGNKSIQMNQVVTMNWFPASADIDKIQKIMTAALLKDCPQVVFPAGKLLCIANIIQLSD